MEFTAAIFGGGLVAGFDPTIVHAANAATASTAAGAGCFILDASGPNAGVLYWDVNGGSGADAVKVALLDGVTSLAASDFLIV